MGVARAIGLPVEPETIRGTFANENDDCICQNCEQTWELSELNQIKDIFQRVAPGEPMPAGECPDCGCLCQLRA
jgi:hypothetical protein